MSEWQPIETAPKDGAIFDVWRQGPNRSSGERVANVRFKKVRITLRKFDTVLCDFAPDELGYMGWQKLPYIDRVTHWMPLPEPPK